MAMTRKDYELIACSIRTRSDSETGDERKALVRLTYHLASNLQEENERFDMVTFITACGFGDTLRKLEVR